MNAINLPAKREAPATTAMQPLGAGLADIYAQAKIAIASGLMPQAIRTPEQAVVIMLKGRELGVPPMQALSQIYVVQGVATCSAQLMLACAYRRLPGFGVEIIEESEAGCTMRFRRSPAHSWVKIAYTAKDAEMAGLLSKQNWRQNRRAMFRARVISAGMKVVAPDMAAGLYTPDEIHEAPQTHVEPDEVAVNPISDEPVDAGPEPINIDVLGPDSTSDASEDWPPEAAPIEPPPSDRESLLSDILTEGKKHNAAWMREKAKEAKVDLKGKTISMLDGMEILALHAAVCA